MQAAIDQMHLNARYVMPQVKMELTNSAGFMFGSANQRAKVENLRFATVRTGTTGPSGDAKNLTTAATSSGLPNRLIGIRPAAAFFASASMADKASVSIYPGHTLFTVIPARATSLASDWLIATTPAFAAA